MKIYISLFALCLWGISCNNDDNLTSNDPSAVLDAPTCYDVYDVNKNYKTLFQPKNAWVGDPIPFYDNGKFYIYYLHDSRPAGKTFHPWYLATTSDFYSFEDKGEAIACGEDNSQEDALGTGSVIKHNGMYYAFYTAHNRNLNPNEKIYLATSKDLLTWEKKTDFSLQASDNYDRNEFRDPYVYKDGSVFRMLVTTRGYIAAVNDWQAVLANYTSTDLINWTLEAPFYYNGERILECPDVFTMGNYEYLIYSNWDWADNNRKVLYRYRTTGSTDWIIPTNDNLNGDFFYGGKTISDGTNRYLIGWIYSLENYRDGERKVWAGSLTTHQLVQNENGTLAIKAPQPLVAAFKNNKSLGTETLSSQTKIYDRLGESANKISMKINANTSNLFGIKLRACGNLRYSYDLLFDVKASQLKLVRKENGQIKSVVTSNDLPIPTDKVFDVTLITEGSAGTIYVNNKVALSFRNYQMNQNVWGIFTDEGTATFSDVVFSN